MLAVAPLPPESRWRRWVSLIFLVVMSCVVMSSLRATTEFKFGEVRQLTSGLPPPTLEAIDAVPSRKTSAPSTTRSSPTTRPPPATAAPPIPLDQMLLDDLMVGAGSAHQLVRQALAYDDAMRTGDSASTGGGFVGPPLSEGFTVTATAARHFVIPNSTSSNSSGEGKQPQYFAAGVETTWLRPIFHVHADRPALVAIVTAWDDRYNWIPRIGRVSLFLKTLLCRRRGYDLYFENAADIMTAAGLRLNRTDESSIHRFERHAQWVKPLLVARYLPHYEWVGWQDPDIFPMDFEYDVIKRHDENYETELIIGEEARIVPVNTGQYYVHRGTFGFSVLNASWYVEPKHWRMNDQGALAHVLKDVITANSPNLKRLPLQVMGGWICMDNPKLRNLHFHYDDPYVHLSFCAGRLDTVVTHLFVASLALNGIFNGTVPQGVTPSVRPAATVSAAHGQPPRVAVVTLPASELQMESPPPEVRNGWIEYCRRQGFAYEDASIGLAAAPHLRWRAVLDVLPYYDWVLWVDPNVDAAEVNVTQLLQRNFTAYDWIVESANATSGISSRVWLVRRTRWSMRVFHESYLFGKLRGRSGYERALRHLSDLKASPKTELWVPLEP